MVNIIKELRKKKGIQQKELALEIGVSCPTVSEWESGKKDPSGERLKKLAQYFDVDELVVLGKNVVTLSSDQNIPRTDEAKIISGVIDKMPPDKREQALNIMKAVFTQYADSFEGKDDDQ